MLVISSERSAVSSRQSRLLTGGPCSILFVSIGLFIFGGPVSNIYISLDAYQFHLIRLITVMGYTNVFVAGSVLHVFTTEGNNRNIETFSQDDMYLHF